MGQGQGHSSKKGKNIPIPQCKTLIGNSSKILVIELQNEYNSKALNRTIKRIGIDVNFCSKLVTMLQENMNDHKCETFQAPGMRT